MKNEPNNAVEPTPASVTPPADAGDRATCLRGSPWTLGRKMNTVSKQCRVKAEQEGFWSVMNNTKWRELCVAFSNLEVKPAWRTKDFITGHVSDWDRDWFHHVGPDYCAIEWLEIKIGENQKEAILYTLKHVGVPFDSSDTLRVYGYRK